MAKAFFKDGKWIDNPNAIAVVVCACGNKYIKTRPQQARCLRCIKEAESKYI
ncbi:MAG TPA: hypothetical protein VMU25_03545 [Candidatus Paceibacterota bacterium]|nr:hypothetical protein [Candidatus Paceibacterota bacterium]